MDLNVLRGWKETHDASLRKEHVLPALGWIVCLDSQGKERWREGVYGPEICIGRYLHQRGPVDLQLSRLQDWECYRIGAPHLRLTWTDPAQDIWHMHVVTSGVQTLLGELRIHGIEQGYRLRDSDIFTLGVTRFMWQRTDVSYQQWRERRDEYIARHNKPALFLMRAGGICGPAYGLGREVQSVIGRSSPPHGMLAAGRKWKKAEPVSWDLAGISEAERRFLSFRHARVSFNGEAWMLSPLSLRQRTYLNREPITHTKRLASGDEIALGTIKLHFCCPNDGL